MPGTPPTSPNLGINRYSDADTAVFSTQVNDITDTIDAQFYRGAVNISAAQSISSPGYATLSTPDEVTGIVLPANGLIRVWYQATWQESIPGDARAAIFIGSSQLQVVGVNEAVATEAAATGGGDNANVNFPLSSCPIGLISQAWGGTTGYSGDATTGQAVGNYFATSVGATAEINGSVVSGIFGSNKVFAGGPCDIFAASGTYTVSVQFKTASGSVTASNRKLWVQALAFG